MDVYNKIDAIDPEERRRLSTGDPSAAVISAITGEGVPELLQQVAARVALDVRRVTITFDGASEYDREQIARLYRFAHVISHVASNGRIRIEADVPRRYIARLTSAPGEGGAHQ
jgi:50S ribosomal subunit-associated GTPase HflX